VDVRHSIVPVVEMQSVKAMLIGDIIVKSVINPCYLLTCSKVVVLERSVSSVWGIKRTAAKNAYLFVIDVRMRLNQKGSLKYLSLSENMCYVTIAHHHQTVNSDNDSHTITVSNHKN